MTSFKEFLAENAHQGYDLIGKLKTVDDLIDVKKIERVQQYFVAFQDAVAEGVIYNVVLTEAKDAANSLFQPAFDVIHTAAKWTFFDNPIYKQLTDAGIDLPYSIDGGNVKKAIRSLDAAQKLITDEAASADISKMKRIAEAYLYFLEAFKSVQSKVIKGRKPAPVDPNAFHSKMGSAHSVATVRTHLLKSITEPLDDFEAQLKAYYEAMLKSIAKAVEGQVEVKPFDATLGFIFQQTYDYRVKGWDKNRVYHDIKVRPTAERWPQKEAAAARKQIEETFLHKNALKLSDLLDKKGNLTSIDVLPGVPVKLHNGAGTLTSVMQVKFADGSMFTVRNKVIINTSSAGRQFYQYPTTFHDVVLADGKKLETPSEEKMIKVFGA